MTVSNTQAVAVRFALTVALFVVFSGVLLPIDAAAVINSATRPSQSQITLNPSYPAPGDRVRANLKQYSLDANQSLVTWRLNGEVVQQGYGELTYNFIAGDVGTLIRIDVTMEDVNGRTLSDSYQTWVGDVAFVWEGRTYTPILYPGRALQSPGAQIALVALPNVVDANGRRYEKDELTYKWVGRSSGELRTGRGKHSILVTNPNPFTTFRVTLTVEDPGGNVRAQRSVEIPVTEPAVQLYEDSPLLGVRYDSALGRTYRMYSTEAVITAEPYYMSASARDDEVLSYEWDIERTLYDNPGSIILRPEGTDAGNATLNLSITNSEYWLQRTGINSDIEFGKRPMWSISDQTTEAI
jgi:hypothetical protein